MKWHHRVSEEYYRTYRYFQMDLNSCKIAVTRKTNTEHVCRLVFFFLSEKVKWKNSRRWKEIASCEIWTHDPRITSAMPYHLAKQAIWWWCGIVTKRYDLYFGSCGHIGVWCLSKCSYDVIMSGGPLGDAPSIGVLCSVYKARCCRTSGLGKKQVSLRHKRTKATQQDLDNHILLYKTNGIDYVPHS